MVDWFVESFSMANPYISEVKYLGGPNADFIEIAVDSGTDVSLMSVTVYHSDGTVRSVSSLGTLVTTIHGKDVYVIDTATSGTFNGLHRFDAVSLDDNGTVFEFISFSDNAATVTATGGAAAGLTSTDIGIAGSGKSLETVDGGASYYTQGTPNSGTVPCFVDGTMILTPDGERPVETLSIGDMVVTRDRGAQKLRWVGAAKVDTYENPETMPICINADALGQGLPVRDLWVSPFHRLIIDDISCQIFFGSREVLIPAKYMQDGQSIRQTSRGRSFAYYHLLFDQHEVIFSDGVASESFFPSRDGLDALSEKTYAEVLALFPELADIKNKFGFTVRPVLAPHEAGLVTSLF